MAYIGIEPGSRSVRTVTKHTATANQSVFNVSGGYVKGFVDVFKQGLKLTEGTDYTANDNLTITLTANASLNDKVDVVAFSPLAIYSVVSKAGDAMTGSLTVPDISSTANVIGANGYFTHLKVDSNTVVNSSLFVTGNTIQTGDYNLTGNINLTGSLTITGAATSVSTQSLNVQDSIIIMASNNSVDTLDIGFAGRYNNGSANVYTGMVRNATDKEFYVFEEYDTVPGNDIDINDASFKLANLHANFNGNLISNSVTVVALNATNGNFTSSITLTGDASGYRQDTTTIYGGDAGVGFGRLEYHNNQWILNAGSDSSNVVAFQRGNLIKSHIDNNGAYNGPLVISGTVTANGGVGTSGQVLTSNSTGVYWSTVTAGATPGGTNTTIQFNDSTNLGGSVGFTFDKTTNNVVIANTLTVGTATVNSTFFSQTANNTNNLGGVAAANYVQNTDSRTLSGNLVISGTYFNPDSNTVLLGNSTQRWVLSANTGSFSGAVSGITTLAAGNTTITGFANASVSVNSALLTVGTSFIANTTGAYHTGTINAASYTTSGIIANTSGVYPTSNTVGTALGSTTNRWNITANAGFFTGQVEIDHTWNTATGAGALYLDALTGNRIDWNTTGIAAPAVTTRSVGTKLVLYPGVSATSVDYGIGVESNHLWLSAADAGSGIKLYANTTQLAVANISGITVNSGGIFPTSNTSATSLGSSTQRWVLNANTGSFAGAVSGITTLAAGNTTITGFVNATSTIQGVSSLTIAGAASGITTLAAGNTTITGFANASVSVNSALLTVGTNFIANTTGAYHTGTVNAASLTIGTTFIANTTQVTLTGIPLSANGSVGTAGHTLHSNGTTGSPYWAADDQGVTSVASGDGLTGGPITSTGTLSVSAQSGLLANSTGLYVNATSIALGTVPTARLGSGTANSTTYLAGDQSWKTITGGSGTVTSIANGAGLTGGTITTSGTLAVSTTQDQRLTFNAGQSSGSLLNATGSLGGIELNCVSGANAAFLAFHRPGLYAAYFGLDTDNQFAVGGWSAGAALANMKVGSFGVGTTASGTAGEIRATNNITAYFSDKRLKKDIELIPDALDKIKSISGVYYKSNDVAKKYGYTDESQQVGVLAQEIEKVLPHAVKMAPFDSKYDSEGNMYSESGENYLTVQYEKLIPVLIQAIKEQQQLIENLEEKVRNLS